MKFFAPKDTMAFQLSRPLNCPIDFSKMRMSEFSKRAKAFLGTGNNSVRPETEALWFYLGNHGLHALRARNPMYAPLSNDDLSLVNHHFKMANKVFLRLFYYTLVICVRETRHLPDKNALMPLLKAEKVENSWSLITKIEDSASGAMQQIIDQQHPELTVYELCKGMSIAFHKLHWPSSFGGKKWGIIADSLVNLVTGKHSPEIFCDVAFALAHNGGPIFNKGMFYGHYGSDLQIILDCQRGGQIPRYVYSKQSNLVTGDMQSYGMKLAKFGEDFVGDIDWEMVQKAGAVGSYNHLFVDKEQAAKKKAESEKHAQLAKLAAEAEAQKKKYMVGEVEYWQGMKVTAITREGLKALK